MVLLASFTAASQTHDIVISVTPQAHQNYKQLINDKPCIDVNHYLQKPVYRGSLELLIICKALTLGGIKPHFIFKTVPNYSRALLETQKGHVAIMGESVWLKNIDTTKLWQTAPIFKSGEYIKGFYTTHSQLAFIESQIKKSQLTKKPTLNVIQTLTVASSNNWVFDWQLLNALDLTVINVPTTQSMCEMIKHNRANVILTDLMMSGSKDILYHCADTVFYPVKGVKITFKQTRHFVVSKQHPTSVVVHQALQTGLAQLRAQGDLAKMFFPETANAALVNNWEDLGTNLDVFF